MFDDFLQQHREEKRRQCERRMTEKRQDFQQLVEYNPWGKPGGGAPTRRIGKSNVFGEDGPAENTFLAFGGPGNGAPNRTRSGRLRTRLPADPTIRFGQPSPIRTLEQDQDQTPCTDLDFAGAIFASATRKSEPKRRREPSTEVVETIREPKPEISAQICQPVGLLEKLGWRQRTSSPPSLRFEDHGGRFNLPSTDVTQQKLRCRFEMPLDRVQHENDLRLQVEERKLNLARRRDEERLANLRHFETWTSFWGRPGHGAPNDTSGLGHRRRGLTNVVRPVRRL